MPIVVLLTASSQALNHRILSPGRTLLVRPLGHPRRHMTSESTTSPTQPAAAANSSQARSESMRMILLQSSAGKYLRSQCYPSVCQGDGNFPPPMRRAPPPAGPRTRCRSARGLAPARRRRCLPSPYHRETRTRSRPLLRRPLGDIRQLHVFFAAQTSPSATSGTTSCSGDRK